MRRLHSQDSARWIAAFDGGRISVGDPVNTFTSSDALFVPSWFLDTLGLEDGAEVELAFEKSEALPKATKLSFKVIGDIPADIDVRDLLEGPLSQLGVLEVGQMIPVPILDGTMLLLQECEPDNVVFLDGEADLEIENDCAPAPAFPKEEAAPALPKQEAQAPVFIPQEVDFSSMISFPTPAPSGFVPFSGVGRTLGGDKGRTLGGDGRRLGSGRDI